MLDKAQHAMKDSFLSFPAVFESSQCSNFPICLTKERDGTVCIQQTFQTESQAEKSRGPAKGRGIVPRIGEGQEDEQEEQSTYC